jgi:hypothetical protein
MIAICLMSTKKPTFLVSFSHDVNTSQNRSSDCSGWILAKESSKHLSELAGALIWDVHSEVVPTTELQYFSHSWILS